MFDSIYNFFVTYQFGTVTALWTFWVPTLFCLIGYFADCVRDFQYDKKHYQDEVYIARLTVGKVLGRFIVSFIPVFNFFAGYFYHGWRLAHDVIDIFSAWLDIPILRHKPKPVAPKAPEPEVSLKNFGPRR